MKIAVAAEPRARLIRHTGLDPRQEPCQRANVKPAAGFAVSVTVPGANVARHFAPQTIPAGLLTTLPRPILRTFRLTGFFAKLAVTFVSAPGVSVQVGLAPEQPPPSQPENTESALGVAVSVTDGHERPCR
jgi:hypothetical protein